KMPEPADAGNADAGAGPGLFGPERVPDGDPRAEQWCDTSGIQGGRPVVDEPVPGDVLAAEPTERARPVVTVFAAIGLRGDLLPPGLLPAQTPLALSARVDDVADRHSVADAELRHRRTDGRDHADELMAGDKGGTCGSRGSRGGAGR